MVGKRSFLSGFCHFYVNVKVGLLKGTLKKQLFFILCEKITHKQQMRL